MVVNKTMQKSLYEQLNDCHRIKYDKLDISVEKIREALEDLYGTKKKKELKLKFNIDGYRKRIDFKSEVNE